MKTPADAAEEWRTLDDFIGGMDANRRPSTDALAGTDVTVTFGDGSVVRQVFDDATTLRWIPENGSEVAERYDAVEVADGIYFVDFARRNRPHESVSQLLSPRTLRVLCVTCTIGDPIPDTPQVGQEFSTGVIGDRRQPPSATEPAPTRDLIGRRALYRYSDIHLYEHVYLNSMRYAWQCLLGPQRGHGDVDLADIYKFDSDIYLVCWREFRIPVACVWAYNLAELHTTGKFFGLSDTGEIRNAPAGSHVTMLAPADYPDGIEPA